MMHIHSVQKLCSSMHKWHAVALIVIVMRCFEHLVMTNIKLTSMWTTTSMPIRRIGLCQMPFPWSSTVVWHFWRAGTQAVRLFFLDCSYCCFNWHHPSAAGSWTSTDCQNPWSTIFFPITLKSGFLQGCVLRPLSQLTCDCSAIHEILWWSLLKAGLWWECSSTTSCHRERGWNILWTNNLYINVGKTKEMVVDFKKRGYTPISSLSVQRL